MSLTPGTRLGPYGIVAPIGAGGMGEVYRAHDTKLNRDVALKLMPDAFAHDAERVARFAREAQTLAALNHANIAQIYGIVEAPSPGGGADHVHALVMELVEGDDLSVLVARGPLPLGDALPIAKQIAEALEAAHEQGIVHRDLKPANIKVRADGTVKVLDFGLAKAFDAAAASSAEVMNSPTLTAHATQMGMIIGTAAYMAPEQAKGRTVDKRADIWAFGVVLYEMLTGRRLFAAEDTSETLAAVLTRDVSLAALPAAVPARLRRLIERCLERDVKVRLRDIGEARVELSAIATSAGADVAPVAASPASPSRLRWIAAGVVVGAVVTALALWASRAPTSSSAGIERARFRLTLPPNVELSTRGGGAVSVSPDGRSIAFVGSMDSKAQLWLRSLDADDAKLLLGTDGASDPFWSPDSAFIGFFTDAKLKRLEIRTGTVQPICDVDPSGGGGATWNRDDVILFSPMLEGSLFRVPAAGGTPVQVTTLDVANHESNHMWPHFLPDGRHFLFQIFGLSNAGLYVATIDGPERQLVVRQESLDATAVQYAPSGQVVYVRNHQLVARPFDVATFKVTGPPVPLAEGFGIGGPGRPAFGVSNNGVLVFQPEGLQGAISQPTWFGRDGSRQGALGARGAYGSLDLSPDGQTVAMDRYGEKETSIWLTDVASGTATRFTSDLYSFSPIWFPQGDRILFESVRDTPPNPFVRTLAGAETRLARLPNDVSITSVAPDGRALIGELHDAKTNFDLWLFSAAADTPPAVFLQTPFSERSARISPDGHRIAFVSNESGQDEIYITTFPVAGRRVRLSTDGGSLPQWLDDGAEVFFKSAGKLMVATVAADPAASTGLRLGAPRALFELPKGAGAWLPARGGRRFLVNVEVTKAVPAPITVVLNWYTLAGRQ